MRKATWRDYVRFYCNIHIGRSRRTGGWIVWLRTPLASIGFCWRYPEYINLSFSTSVRVSFWPAIPVTEGAFLYKWNWEHKFGHSIQYEELMNAR